MKGQPAAASAGAPPDGAAVLGIDPGLRATGWAVLSEHAGRTAITCGVVRPNPRAPTSERLRAIVEGMLAVIDTHRPAAVAVERAFVRENVRTALALGQAQAVALLAAAWRDLPVREYAPREIKQVTTGDGAADKRAVAEALRRQLGLRTLPAPHDASDALAVAFCHRQLAASERRILQRARTARPLKGAVSPPGVRGAAVVR